MKKRFTMRSASRALAISAVGIMAFGTASLSAAQDQSRQNFASSSSSMSASIEGRPGESYEIISENGTTTAFHILETGDRLEVPLTETADGTSQITLRDGQIVDVSKNGGAFGQSSSSYSNGSGGTGSYSSSSNSGSTDFGDLSEFWGGQSGDTSSSENAEDNRNRYRNMGQRQRERLKNMREKQRKRLEEMSNLNRESWNSSRGKRIDPSANDGQSGDKNSWSDYSSRGDNYSTPEARRARMNEMRERLMARAGNNSNLADLLAGSSPNTGSMASAQRQMDRAMRQLKALEQNGNASPELKKAMRDLERAQSSLNKAGE